MRFDADHRVRCWIEIFQRPAEDIDSDVELGQLLCLLLKILRAQVFEQPTGTRSPADEIDSTSLPPDDV